MVSGKDSYAVNATVDSTKNTWKALLHPAEAGGDYTIIATSGGKYITLERVTFGDVWYCAGQSNMALQISHTFGRWSTVESIKAGKYSNIRIHGIAGNMNPNLPWTNMSTIAANNESLLSYSSTCWYFGQSLTDELGADAPPIGLIHTAFGGSRIEQWLDNKTLDTCGGVSRGDSDQSWHEARVLPYIDTVLKGWVWHQGENDMHDYFGNSALHTGYGCNLVNLVKTWRELWSASSGTTDPLAPFGVATIANSGTEGGKSIGAMHWAQTANYGVLPNPAMPNTFLAQTFDLNDPFGNITCYKADCCDPTVYPIVDNTSNPKCHSCFGKGSYCDLIRQANFYMGPIHPRDKLQSGQRIAKAASVIAYNKPGPYTGPTISGCSASDGKITVHFNATLLGSDAVVVKDYSKTMKSAMQVLTNSSLFCMQTDDDGTCRDDGAGHSKSWKGKFDDDSTWQEVDIVSASATSLTVDLTKSGGIAFAIRYGWDGECCSKDHGKDGAQCPPASCPVMSKVSGHPANPFVAKIVNGKCSCLAPQVCDEIGDEQHIVI